MNRASLVSLALLCMTMAACSAGDTQPETSDQGVHDAASDVGDADLGWPDASEDVGTDMAPPEPPIGMERWLSGSPEDAQIELGDPGLILMGGGREPDEAFEWWRDEIAGGDIVVLRVSGSDGYNDYLHTEIGGFNSVETLKVTSRALADDPYVAWRIDQAEGVFIAGGDQWDFVSLWTDTALNRALQRIWDRGAHLGGTSAGLAVLGQTVFSAENGSVTTDEALADPFNTYMTLPGGFLALPPLVNTVTDSHFAERDRMGRLIAFVARMRTPGTPQSRGIGVDESTALLVSSTERVVGTGAVYVVEASTPPEDCTEGNPLQWDVVNVTKRTAENSMSYDVGVGFGMTSPAVPY